MGMQNGMGKVGGAGEVGGHGWGSSTAAPDASTNTREQQHRINTTVPF